MEIKEAFSGCLDVTVVWWFFEVNEKNGSNNLLISEARERPTTRSMAEADRRLALSFPKLPPRFPALPVLGWFFVMIAASRLACRGLLRRRLRFLRFICAREHGRNTGDVTQLRSFVEKAIDRMEFGAASRHGQDVLTTQAASCDS
jgi:hypothetical protein